ncbi:hypothetical protein MesoLj131a_35550 [Mesorhizobium sp. 131-2-1]|nr:hypothetical protein MesoLj131a_35550 [Mesorhizobium sp. 131-2-1]
MGTKRILRHHLVRDLQRQIRLHTTRHIALCKLIALEIGLRCEFGPLSAEVSLLGIGLRADRHIFTRRHRHRARDQAGNPCDENIACRGIGRRNADDQAGRRYDAVIGAKHGSAQPTDARYEMAFTMQAAHVVTVCAASPAAAS